ncbi:sigma-54-dependent Fis family transcriptional regulator [Clostridium bowmanii]|uniref:sigma-54-dependent Fis family transcriptional regulator n=1 Tax=Clostridium bowmanii TaxID=132925 RepID=UPI001C0C73AF|nr:sigma-54-dependent Fis family transcriptional regulator [Clostridium bowmanii]MBU3190799.1 sigma-54-dependent Fis family transcriptional regulator [Clostridium bowmanii]MCA1075297.1 sigma-54-dependent Fis family transcriptional regulator [Clostridium bowmanii]
MDEYIEASHIRCKIMGLLPGNLFSTKVLEGMELQKNLDKNSELILTAATFINHLYDFVRGSEFFALLCDGEGCILNVVGDEKILYEASKLKMVTGAYMDEAHIGTNAMSLVITERRPSQVSGEEHFIHVYHKWTCSAAPINDEFGNIIGIINLTGFIENVNPHTLGMVVAAANAIERMLENNKYNLMIELCKKRLETTFDSITSGILTCDLLGNITTMNMQVANMFGYNAGEMKHMKIPDLIYNFNEIVQRLKSKETFMDEDIYVNTPANKLQFTLTAYPIYSLNMKIEEITLVFYEIKKSRKLAGRILSGQAIYTFDKIIGVNENFNKLVRYAKKIADSKSTILITGESGTGKEVFAQAIHNCSNRCEEPFIAVNCGAIPRTLIESELFGYEGGAFTGAKKAGNIGKFEIAEGGTIFLDEIGEMPTDLQIRLLRVIEEGVINRIGSSKQINSDVRVMAASNKDLKHEVEIGNFRKDLYYRLNVLPLYLPPLRERRDDIAELVNYYMSKTSKRLNKHSVDISEEYMGYLKNYDWPGNIRELENVIERIVNSEVIQMNLYNEIVEEERSIDLYVGNTLEQMEKHHISEVIKEVKGNMTLAAKILDIARSSLYRKVEKYNIDYQKIEG